MFVCLFLQMKKELSHTSFSFIILTVAKKILHSIYIYLYTVSCYSNVRPITVIWSRISFNWDSILFT